MKPSAHALLLCLSAVLLLIIFTGCGQDTSSLQTDSGDLSSTEHGSETEQRLFRLVDRYLPEDIEEIEIKDSDIADFDGLISCLYSFSNLSVIDFSDNEISVQQLLTLSEAFPEAEIKCKTYVDLCGKKISTSAEEIDLSDISDIDVRELELALSYLPRVRCVVSDKEISVYDKEGLISTYPGINFDIPGVLELYGVTVRDDAELIGLTGKNAEYEDIAGALKRLPRAARVILYGAELSLADQLTLVTEFPDVVFLWEVEILGEKYDSASVEIDLSGKPELTAETIQNSIAVMQGLKHIDVSDCGADNEELAVLREKFPGVKIVWKLYMGKWSLKTDAVAFSVLIYDYDYTRLKTGDIEVLKYCTDLQALDLGHQAITDVSVIGEYLRELRILILVDNKISDLTPLASLKHLHYLELFVNSPLKDISPLGECKELVDLNISHLYNIRDISALLDLPMLERLWIEHTATSAADIELLRRTYPDAKIIVDGYGSVDQGWRTHKRYYAMIDMFKKTDYISEEFSKYDR